MRTIPFDSEKNRKFYKKRGVEFCRCIVCDRHFPELLMQSRGVSFRIYWKGVVNTVLRDGAAIFKNICDDCVKSLADAVEYKKKKYVIDSSVEVEGLKIHELDAPGKVS